MLTGIHFLTTYACNLECDHCFLYCGPRAAGTFTLEQIRQVMDEAVRLGTIQSVCFEGGEPFLYYPLVLAGVDLARQRGFSAGIVTNAYWATSAADAELWLRPLRERGVTSISLSDDPLHYGESAGEHAQRVIAAAANLGMTAKVLRADRPRVSPPSGEPAQDARPAITGGVMFRGRAAEKLPADLPRRPWQELTRCPHEDLADPRRIHVDCLGHVHLCQGLSMGNFRQAPFADLVRAYQGREHPIVGPLLDGGPAELVRRYELPHESSYVDECHLCFHARRALICRFPQYLAPPQVYGLD